MARYLVFRFTGRSREVVGIYHAPAQLRGKRAYTDAAHAWERKHPGIAVGTNQRIELGAWRAWPRGVRLTALALEETAIEQSDAGGFAAVNDGPETDCLPMDYAAGRMGAYAGQPGSAGTTGREICPACNCPIYADEPFARPIYANSHDTSNEYYHRACFFDRFPALIGAD